MKDERKTERNTEWSDEAEADRDFLREKLKNAGDPALPASLSAAALFERMDAEEQRAAEPAAPAPEKKGGVIWLQWRRWGSIAAVLVLAAGTAFLLQNSSLQNKASQDESSYDAALAPNEAENQDQWYGAATGGPPTDGLMMAPPPNPSTAGGDGSEKKEYSTTDEIDSDRGLFEEFKSKIVSVGEQPIPEMLDYVALAAVCGQLFGNVFVLGIGMFCVSGEGWVGCELPTSCAHYFMLDKALYGFFPEERRVVDYSGACATVLNEDEAAMLSAILQIEFTAKTE